MKKTIVLLLLLIMCMGTICSCDDSNASDKTESIRSSSDISSVQTSSRKSPNRSEYVAETSNYVSSQTESEMIKNPGINPTKTPQMNAYHFSPYWTNYFGTDQKSRYEEFEMVLKNGYFNSVTVPPSVLVEDKFWQACEKYNLTVWIHHGFGYFNSQKTTIDAYIDKYDAQIQYAKKSPERWKRVLGFHFEENVWRGQSLDDYLTETKSFYQKYGKRIWAVYATGEFLGIEGNQEITGDSADGKTKLTTESLKFTTDISFDSYTVDVREGTNCSHRLSDWHEKISPNIKETPDYYIEIMNRLKKLTGHPANVWYFPTAYTCYLACGLGGITFADEGFCVGHLKFFKELLEKEEYVGGLSLYTYYKSGEHSTMQEFLDIRDENGLSQIYIDSPKWMEYSQLLKDITREYRSKEINLLPL